MNFFNKKPTVPMNLKVKDLAKVKKLVDQLQDVDAEIIKVEKMAQYVATNDVELSHVKLNIKEKQEKKTEFKSSGDDATDAFIMATNQMKNILLEGRGIWAMDYNKQKKEDDKNYLCMELNERETLQILGVLIGSKNRKRDVILKQLATFGITQ